MCPAELPRRQGLAASALHQPLMDLPRQSQTNGKLFQSFQPIFQCIDVIKDLLDTLTWSLSSGGGLSREQFRQGSLRSLDPAGKYCFTSGEGLNQQMRVWNRAGNAGQLSQGPICVGYSLCELPSDFQFWRERVGHKCPLLSSGIVDRK